MCKYVCDNMRMNRCDCLVDVHQSQSARTLTSRDLTRDDDYSDEPIRHSGSESDEYSPVQERNESRISIIELSEISVRYLVNLQLFCFYIKKCLTYWLI